ncbi:MAG: transposase [Flavisolibacter sp.]|nr:transposase [Flavisolibacter sp.]
MAQELQRAGVTYVAMEATGVYWMAVYEVLEQYGLKVTLINARHYKNVEGHKTDVKDCQRIQQCIHMVCFGHPILPKNSIERYEPIFMKAVCCKNKKVIR